MTRDMLERLRCFGFAPRAMLDVGAQMGDFAHAFLKVFPQCRPVLIEPNPHCQDELARLPAERHMFAASDANGRIEASYGGFALQAAGQAAGTSQWRGQPVRAGGDAASSQAVSAKRIDDAFSGRRFEFVRIAAPGLEMAAVSGGETILRQAEFILIDVPLANSGKAGSGPGEIVAKLGAIGFHCADICEAPGESGGSPSGMSQMSLLFERNVRRPSQNFSYTPMHDHGALLRFLSDQRAKCGDFRVIDVGAAANPWSRDVIDATFDMNDCAAAPLHFKGNLNDPRSWDPVLRHVAEHGRFSFAICAHTLEDLAYPAVTLEMLPRIADAGFVSIPSRYLESLRPEGPYRGFIHHRWILDQDAETGRLILAPKIPVLEHLAVPQEHDWAQAKHKFELQMMWRGAISFAPLNQDYLGPTRKHVVDMYAQFIDRP